MDQTKLKLNIGFIIFLSFIQSDKLIKWRKGVQIQERLLWANINWIEEGNLLSPFLSLNFKVEKVGIKDLELKLILYFFSQSWLLLFQTDYQRRLFFCRQEIFDLLIKYYHLRKRPI